MLGNQQVGYYDYILEMTTNQANKGITFDGESYIYYANVSDPVADDLTWEKVITYNLGLDLGFFNNRLGVSGDFYIRDTKDMLTSGAQLSPMCMEPLCPIPTVRIFAPKVMNFL